MPDATDIPLIAIGDIHGRADLLDQLLAEIETRYANVPIRTIFLGDYVDRGPDSRGVIDRLIAYGERHADTVFLKGNHEEAMLDFLGVGDEAEAWLTWGGEETLASYGIRAAWPLDVGNAQEELAAILPDSHFRFLMNLRMTHTEQGYLFVHAGLDPDRSIADQRDRDLLWIRAPFYERGEGRFPGLTIVHGHTPVKRVENLGWRINIDTGAFWSSRLTALIIEGGTRQFIST